MTLAKISFYCSLKENNFTQFDDKQSASNWGKFYSKLALETYLPRNVCREILLSHEYTFQFI